MGVAVWNTCQVCQKTINKNEISHEILLANHHEFLLAPPEISFFDLSVAPCSYTLPINEHETTFGFQIWKRICQYCTLLLAIYIYDILTLNS